eukprot:1560445-Pleurochrysis_carterae.AAC.1
MEKLKRTLRRIVEGSRERVRFQNDAREVFKELVKGRDGGYQRHELERRNAVGATRVRREGKGEEDRGISLRARGHRPVAPLWRHPWKQTGSAQSAARARAGAGAWQRRGVACNCCVRGTLATGGAAYS